MSSRLTLLVLAVLLAVSVAANINVRPHWKKLHCNAPPKGTTMSFQVFLKLQNEQLLHAYVNSNGGKQTGPHGPALADLRAKHNVAALARAESPEAKLSYWRGVLHPSKSVSDAAAAWLTAASAPCVASWDSYTCANVPVSTVGSLFGINVCTYANVHTGAPRLFLDDVATNNDGTLKRLPSFLHTVTGLTQFDPTVEPRRAIATKKVSSGAQDEGYPNWPSPVKKGAPVVVAFALNEGVPNQMEFAVSCADGTPAKATKGAVKGSDWCKGAYPTSITLKVATMDGKPAVADTDIPMTDAACQAAGSYYGRLSDHILCSYFPDGPALALDLWVEYRIAVVQKFSDGTASDPVPINNYVAGQFFNTSMHDGRLSEVTVINPTPFLTPDIKAMYGVPKDSRAQTSQVVQAVLEFSERGGSNAFSPDDLAQYLVLAGVTTKDESAAYVAKWLTVVNGDPFGQGFGIRGETSLDVEMMMGIFTEAPTVMWNMPYGGSTDSAFADAVMAWAVNITSGNSGLAVLPTVWSISYGGPCDMKVIERSEIALAMMAAAGIAVHVASGDAGSYAGSPPGNYPGTSHYVIAVGATARKRKDKQGMVYEVPSTSAQSNVITSGGGFSSSLDVTPAQNTTLAAFIQDRLAEEKKRLGSKFSMKDFDAKYPPQRRAVPDVAAYGSQITIVLQGSPMTVFGTSCSSPIFGAMVALATDRRIKAGKAALPNLLTSIYAWPQVFIDVTEGDNCAGEIMGDIDNFQTFDWQNCYASAVGFDLVTGLGTLNYTKFETALLAA